MKVKKAFVYIALFVIGWLGISVILYELRLRSLQSALGVSTGDLKRRDRKILNLLDSIQILRKERTEKDRLWMELLDEKNSLLDTEKVKLKTLKKQYEKLKNSSPPEWTNAELDSLLDSIIR